VLKIHDDRIFKDAVSFKELQKMARRCIEMPDDSEEEEMDWLERMGSFGDLTEESEFGSSKGLNSGSVTVTRMMEQDGQAPKSRETRMKLWCPPLRMVHQSGSSFQRSFYRRVQAASEQN
jgi:hypothetical protein